MLDDSQSDRCDTVSGRGIIEPGLFADMQKEYFAHLLEQKWACEGPGHNVCIPTAAGEHCRLSDDDIEAWVEALCAGNSSTDRPPDNVLTTMTHQSIHWKDDTTMPRVISLLPSRRITQRSHTLSATASIRSKLESSRSLASSGVPGPGYYSGKALQWVGSKILNAVEKAIIFKRTYQHISLLKQWEKENTSELGFKQKKKLFRILDDALEMSSPHYSQRVNKSALHIRKAVDDWTTENLAEEEIEMHSRIRVCLAPLELARWDVPRTADLMWELHETLTRVPVALQDAHTTSDVICALAKDLAFAHYEIKHLVISLRLWRIVETTVKIRPLTVVELKAIGSVAARHLEHREQEDQRWEEYFKWQIEWELKLFAQCSAQDPWFKEVALGPHGLQSKIIYALEEFLSKLVPARDVEWGHLHCIIDVLIKWSWDARIVDTLQATVIISLLKVLRRPLPEGWSDIHLRAIYIILNVVKRQPLMMQTLIEDDAASVLMRFISSPSEQGLEAKPLDFGSARAVKQLLVELEKQSRGGTKAVFKSGMEVETVEIRAQTQTESRVAAATRCETTFVRVD